MIWKHLAPIVYGSLFIYMAYRSESLFLGILTGVYIGVLLSHYMESYWERQKAK